MAPLANPRHGFHPRGLRNYLPNRCLDRSGTCEPPRAASWGARGCGCSHAHLRQIVPDRHVLGEVFLRNPLLHRELSVLHTADIAIDDAYMVFLADYLVALRVRERVLQLNAFERLDHALDILAA